MILERAQRRHSTLEKQKATERKKKGRPYVSSYPVSFAMLDDETAPSRACKCGNREPVDMDLIREAWREKRTEISA